MCPIHFTQLERLAHLRDQGLVHVRGRNVEILDMTGLKHLVAGGNRHERE